jgi:hypothetical protein
MRRRRSADVGIKFGSTRVPRVSSGVAPELSSHQLNVFTIEEKLVERSFRRDAENHTPEACATIKPRR